MTTDLDQHAARVLTPLGISLATTERLVLTHTHPTRQYATTAAMDTFYRLRARATRTAAQRTTYAPTLPPASPLAVTADGPSFHISDGRSTDTIDTDGLLTALTDARVTARHTTHRTLVVDTTATLHALASLARQTSTPTEIAAALDWWAQRAAHPGTGATRVLSRVLPLRWTLGLPPTAKPDLHDWATWTGTDEGTNTAETALALATALGQGSTLPWLLDCHGEDSRSWTWLREHQVPRWRAYDSRRDAALGLLTRSQSAEYYDSLRLADPLIADAETRTGTVVETSVTAVDGKTATLAARGTLNRHRAGTAVRGWRGDATAARPDSFALSGVLGDVIVDANGTLVLAIIDMVKPGQVEVGDPITLRPRTIDPFQQSTFRSTYGRHFGSGRNWLARAAAPTLTRRAVPLDVVVAAAEE